MTEAAAPVIQCSTGPFWALELEDAMDALADAGFRDIELMVTRDPRTHEPDLPVELAEERGLRIATVHGPFLALTKTVWGLDPLEKIRRGVRFCRAVGARLLIVHPPYLWEQRFARWVEDEAVAFCTQHDVVVAVETMYPKWMAGRQLRGHRWIEPAELARRAPFVALDTSHLGVARQDILNAYRTLSHKLVHVHLSDNAGDGRDGHLAIEQGILPIERLLEEIRTTDYGGTISLELSMRRFIQRPKALVDMLRANKEFVESRLAQKRRMAKGMPRP